MRGLFLYLVRRLLWMLLTLWIVFTLSFVLAKSVPGNPFSGERNIPTAIRRQLEAKHGLDKPWPTQYRIMLGNLVLRGDFGWSTKLEDYSVGEVIAEGFPVSASLAIFALVFAVAFGVTAGVVSATRRGGIADTSLMVLAILGIAVPNFVLASLAILLFVFMIPIFPAAGWGTFGQIVLPAFCLAAPIAAYIARLSRSGMLEVLNRDYVRTAWAKGLPARTVLLKHAVPAALLPVVSYLGPASAAVLTGSLVLERIFALPGMGSHFVEAALQRDVTLAIGMTLVYTVILFTMNTLVDISYSVIDPRVKLS